MRATEEIRDDLTELKEAISVNYAALLASREGSARGRSLSQQRATLLRAQEALRAELSRAINTPTNYAAQP